MKKTFVWFLVAGAMALPGIASAQNSTGNVNVFLGAKALDDDEWTADEQSEIGLLLDFAPQGWPINFAVDFLRSEGDETASGYIPGWGYVTAKEEVETTELNLGVRKYWDIAPNMHPYIGGGLAFIQLDGKWSISGLGSYEDDGDGTGIWLNGGITWTFDAFNVGLDVRYSQGEVFMDIGDYEGGGGHAGLVVGYHW